jgi:hypothetical protein
VARTLNNLGNLYRETQRLIEAEDSYREAIDTFRELAETNPAAYRQTVAATLIGLGVLYHNTQRLSEAPSPDFAQICDRGAAGRIAANAGLVPGGKRV